ncbi:MAG TPA: putative zinc-binding protein [Bacteroidales bacterium]
METKNTSCNCSNSGEYLVMACSGASDVGQVSDLVARKLRDNNQRAMKCLAMVAAGDEKFIESCKNANVLVIDGCPIDCGRKIMEKSGLANYNYIRLSDWGYKKGQTPATPELVSEVYEKAVLHC